MKIFSGILILFSLSVNQLKAQELFPLNEPASNVPKGVLGVRAFGDSFQEIKLLRNLFAVKVMYGLLPKLSVMATASTTNHHSVEFPANLASHTHNGNKSVYSTGNFTRGLVYPYLFTGLNLYAKYRFLTVDGQNTHFRMAAYGEWSNTNVAHDETEPNLLDDTKGYGGGLISTYLVHHLAVSLTSGFIIPGSFIGSCPDLLGGPDVPTEIKYGRALKYDLSFGYLLFPKKYENYKQTNVNVYLEFMGKSYEAATVTQFGFVNVPIQTPLLKAGNYVDICPGIQTITGSNLRLDLSVEFAMINKSYAHFYPVVMFGMQRYFYFNKKKDKTSKTS